ncbi:MAG: hypothetical protein H6841_02515 [Planctomycetes bacterium]|nr:hypothetical protein [Planctomycetota bacterium]MCB9936541.1 hypothetical protein [Planctomycetota bacterium]
MSDTKEFTVADLIRKRMSGEKSFAPHTLYDPDADCVTYFHIDVPTHSDQIDPFVTLYYEQASGTLAGYKVKCVRMLVRKLVEEQHMSPDAIRFGDVLDLAAKMSEDHRKKAERRQAKESELADTLLPNVG